MSLVRSEVTLFEKKDVKGYRSIRSWNAEFTELEEALSGLKVYGHRGLGGF